MRYTQWVNLGRDMALVDERGRLRGLIITLDDQIGRKINKAFYEAPRERESEAFDKGDIPRMKVKENSRNTA